MWNLSNYKQATSGFTHFKQINKLINKTNKQEQIISIKLLRCNSDILILIGRQEQALFSFQKIRVSVDKNQHGLILVETRVTLKMNSKRFEFPSISPPSIKYRS